MVTEPITHEAKATPSHKDKTDFSISIYIQTRKEAKVAWAITFLDGFADWIG